MGEDRAGDRAPTERRLTVSQAGHELGISAEAVRSRLKRGTLQSVKEVGVVYVLLEADQARPVGDQTVPVEALREQIGYLQGVIATRDRELQTRAEEIRRRDQALEREQELTAMFADRLRQLESPRNEREASQTAASEPEGEEPGPEAAGPQTGSQKPWWRRIFGG